MNKWTHLHEDLVESEEIFVRVSAKLEILVGLWVPFAILMVRIHNLERSADLEKNKRDEAPK